MKRWWPWRRDGRWQVAVRGRAGRDQSFSSAPRMSAVRSATMWRASSRISALPPPATIRRVLTRRRSGCAATLRTACTTSTRWLDHHRRAAGSGRQLLLFHNGHGSALPLVQAYENDPSFYELATKLGEPDFTTLAQRRDLTAQALELSIKESQPCLVGDQAHLCAVSQRCPGRGGPLWFPSVAPGCGRSRSSV